MPDYSFSSLQDFLQLAGEQGLIKASTAQGYRVATSKIESTLMEQEAADVRNIDVEALFTRYGNANRLKVKPSTLREYRRRLSSAIAEFTSYQADPTNYQPKTKRSSGPRTRRSTTGGAQKPEEPRTVTAQETSGINALPSYSSIDIPIPPQSRLPRQRPGPKGSDDMRSQPARGVHPYACGGL